MIQYFFLSRAMFFFCVYFHRLHFLLKHAPKDIKQVVGKLRFDWLDALLGINFRKKRENCDNNQVKIKMENVYTEQCTHWSKSWKNNTPAKRNRLRWWDHGRQSQLKWVPQVTKRLWKDALNRNLKASLCHHVSNFYLMSTGRYWKRRIMTKKAGTDKRQDCENFKRHLTWNEYKVGKESHSAR